MADEFPAVLMWFEERLEAEQAPPSFESLVSAPVACEAPALPASSSLAPRGSEAPAPAREEQPGRKAFRDRRKREAGLRRDWPRELSSLLDSSELRMLSKEERRVLAQFCAAHTVPLLSKGEINALLQIEDSSSDIALDAATRTFYRDEYVITYASRRSAFKGLLLEAKELIEWGSSHACDHLVGVCLEHFCVVNSRRPRQRGSTSPPSKRKPKEQRPEDEGETKAKKQRTACPSSSASPYFRKAEEALVGLLFKDDDEEADEAASSSGSSSPSMTQAG